MRKAAMYGVQPPRGCSDEFMFHDFYIAVGPDAHKVASYWADSGPKARYELLKCAAELKDDDITAAYTEIMKKTKDEDAEPEPAEDDDDGLEEDSSLEEDSDVDEEDEDEDLEEDSDVDEEE